MSAKKKTTEQFIEEATNKHNGKYDYSKTEYVNPHTKIKIICHKKNEFGEEHGKFLQMPYSHLQGVGCPKCGSVYRYNTKTFYV